MHMVLGACLFPTARMEPLIIHRAAEEALKEAFLSSGRVNSRPNALLLPNKMKNKTQKDHTVAKLLNHMPEQSA